MTVMAYHPFERICSLWFERIKNHFVLENYPIRYDRQKKSKYSPSTATTDFDLITYDLKKPKTLNVIECKSNINTTSHTKSKTRLLAQLKELNNHAKQLPFIKKVKTVKRWVFGIKIANRITRDIPNDVEIIEGETFENQVLDGLIMHIAKDPRMDPKDDILSIIRLFWHFGVLNDKYYVKQTEQILHNQGQKITARQLKQALGLVSYKIDYCKDLLKRTKK